MIWLILGVLAGALPGFHPNLLVGLPLLRSNLFPLVFGSIFSSIIPALLMVPTSEMAPLLLPGQEAAKKGKMQGAIEKFAGGALLGALLFFVTYPLYIFIVPLKSVLTKLTLPFLVFTVAVTLLKSRRPHIALFVFALSGLYGALILGSGIDSNIVLGAHFSAMFGLAGLFLSSKLAKQEPSKPRIVLEYAPSVVGFFGGLLISMFPAITPAQAYAVLLLIFGAGAKGISAAGSLASSSFLLSFMSLDYLGKGRMAAVEVIRNLEVQNILVYSLVAYVLVIFFSKWLVQVINKIHNIREIMMVGIFLSIAIFYKDAALIALISLFFGFLPGKLGVERVHLMGSLIVPTMLWYAL